MKADIKELWLDALTSYQQGSGRLVDSQGKVEKWCCLGVLTDLYCKTPDAAFERDGDCFRRKDRLDIHAGIIFEAMPPMAVHDWAGLSGEEGDFLAALNDDGTPFIAISRYIEKHL